jgi:hypothetical protein
MYLNISKNTKVIIGANILFNIEAGFKEKTIFEKPKYIPSR